jgi:hypothetical protein
VECLSWREGTLLGSPDACPDVQTEGKCWVPVGRVRLTGPATPVTVGWRGSVQTWSESWQGPGQWSLHQKGNLTLKRRRRHFVAYE